MRQWIKKYKTYFALKKSGLFNATFYLFTYPQVRKADIDPLLHYIEYGANEGRYPNPDFDTAYYLKRYPDIKKSQINPLLHYYEFGKREGRSISAPLKKAAPVPLKKGSVDIIIPVYNALDDVMRCMDALYTTKSYDFNLIVVDDCSDTPTQKYLQQMANKYHFTLLRNSENLRFTKTVNRALQKTKGEYVVLLNSDTIVTEKWLEKTISCFKSDASIGIVGPLSNAASWQSIPVRDDPETKGWMINEIPEHYSIDDMGKLVEVISQKRYPRVPSANGFCYTIKREVIDTIGFLDTENFPTGYGEEDDYSIRTTNAGFTIAIADDTYIYHAKSKSYTHEIRKVLTKGGRKTLDRKHTKARIDKLISDWKAEPLLPQIAKCIQSYMHVAEQNEKVVYTAIFGDYDDLKVPDYVNADWDYVCFTNNKKITSDIYTIKYVDAVFANSTKNARMIKLLSHLFLINYKYSLWIDGSVRLRGENINELVQKNRPQEHIMLHQHVHRYCVYDELKACIYAKKDNKEVMQKQIKQYRDAGFPEHHGLVETAELFRQHRHPHIKRVNLDWWHELHTHSIRDQLSFNYVCWKNNFHYTIMDGIQWVDRYFNLYQHGVSTTLKHEPSVCITLIITDDDLQKGVALVKSIFSKTAYRDFHLLLFYTGKSTKNHTILEETAASYNNCNFIPEADRSVTWIKNSVIQNNLSEYLCFIKPNFLLLEHNWLEMLVSSLIQHPGAIVSGAVVLDSEYKILSTILKFKEHDDRSIEVEHSSYFHVKEEGFALNNTLLLVDRKKALNVVPFKEENGIDADLHFCLDALETGYHTRLVRNVQIIDTAPRKSAYSIQRSYQGDLWQKNLERSLS